MSIINSIKQKDTGSAGHAHNKLNKANGYRTCRARTIFNKSTQKEKAFLLTVEEAFVSILTITQFNSYIVHIIRNLFDNLLV